MGPGLVNGRGEGSETGVDGARRVRPRDLDRRRGPASRPPSSGIWPTPRRSAWTP